MTELNCSIEYDYSFEQIDCHWELTRFFRLTWNKSEGTILFYRLGEHTGNIIDYKTIDTDKIYTKYDSYIYELPLSTFSYNELNAARDSDGWITLTVYNGSNYKTFTKFYLLELPPVAVEQTSSEKIITPEYVTTNPGEIKVYWSASDFAELDDSDAENSPDSLDGYSIELFYKPEKATEFMQLKGITWNTTELAKGVYKLVKDPNYTEPDIANAAGLGDEASFGSNHTMSEVYIENPLVTNFYFTPKSLGILPGSEYQIKVYPYSHYEGALISSTEAESDIIKVPKGIVRVYNGTTWVEGQVWVMTESGWIEADSIYTMTNDGWKETT